MRSVLRLFWNVVRAPILIVLIFCEPVVGFICAMGLILGIITSILFEVSAVGPRFPFLGMMAVSLSFGVALFLYHGLIAFFIKD